jgi:hypothetical protein
VSAHDLKSLLPKLTDSSKKDQCNGERSATIVDAVCGSRPDDRTGLKGTSE